MEGHFLEKAAMAVVIGSNERNSAIRGIYVEDGFRHKNADLIRASQTSADVGGRLHIVCRRNGLLIAPRFDAAAKARVQARAFFHRLLRWRHHPRTLLLHPVDQHRDRGRRENKAERDGGGRPQH